MFKLPDVLYATSGIRFDWFNYSCLISSSIVKKTAWWKGKSYKPIEEEIYIYIVIPAFEVKTGARALAFSVWRPSVANVTDRFQLVQLAVPGRATIGAVSSGDPSKDRLVLFQDAVCSSECRVQENCFLHGRIH